jgi:lysyl-tRNA synthetase class 2
MSIPFIEANDQTRARAEHLEELRRLVGNVYPNKYERSRETGDEDTITRVLEKFKKYEPEAEEGERPAQEELDQACAFLNEVKVRISGRISTPPRVMGKAAFVHLSDGVSRLQIYVRKSDVKGIHNDDNEQIEEGWEMFKLLDHGDFIGVSGYLFVTKTGELSVHVETLQFLAKAMLPMPDKMHGISDPEIRQRQRYADLIAGSLKVEVGEEGDSASRELSSREVFIRRSRVITEMRRFLDDHGYIEVETPMLTPKATGAAARPFKTHHNALDIDLYARIAPELYLKRLVVGGFEKVYELNRNFRNEGISSRHNPEFTMLEFYCAYMDVNGMMDFCEELLRMVALKTTGHFLLNYSNDLIEFRNFARLTIKQAIAQQWSQSTFGDVLNLEIDEEWLDEPFNVLALAAFVRLHKAADHAADSTEGEAGLEREADDMHEMWQRAEEEAERAVESTEGLETKAGLDIMEIFEELVEPGLIQPTFITDFPKPVSPLSKASPENPAIAERFELFIAGMECANGFSELNDPKEQYERFLDQAQARERGDDEAMVLDEDYIRALSYGMPPAAGIGIGIDRLVMLLTNKRSIRDVILFPHMRPETNMILVNLDSRTRDLMLKEIEVDASSERGLFVSNRLSESGRRDYQSLLEEAIKSYDHKWLADSLRANGRMKMEEEKRKPKGGYTMAKIPVTAPDTLAEGEFNRFYMRALCRRAIEDGISELIVYRAKETKNPRSESERKVNTRVAPDKLLEDLRSHTGVDTALGLPPGPNSGLSVRLPSGMDESAT